METLKDESVQLNNKETKRMHLMLLGFVDLKRYEGHYMIDKRCVVYSLKSNKPLKTYDNGSGYAKVDLCKGGIRNKQYVHRLGAVMFLSNPQKKKYINHIDGDPSNNDIVNLEWCTHSENHLHAYKIGLNTPNRGVGSNFTEEQIKCVRRFKKQGRHRKDVYKMYSQNCTFRSFENIWYGYVWKNKKIGDII